MSPTPSRQTPEVTVDEGGLHTQNLPHIRHPLIPDLLEVTGLSYYWGTLSQRKAEALLHDSPDGSFLLRNSSQDGCAFSVTFRRRGLTRHARVQYCNEHYSFHWGCFRAPSVPILLDYYSDPTLCTYFEPLLTRPWIRNFPLTLQELCRATINMYVMYESIQKMPLPRAMKEYLWECHYKEKPLETN
ncbi:suppressor of cytokine signaling 4 [Bombina bombina]|uniref:suppressor of cytokine signaling 4 n=1 Tax=Bombina bombina TaxID=8345 RepID=UPI00235AF5BC|nr:suppressor of cytokine signaling 4 [Bombina bombina]